jgi:hypothetical protein
MAIFGWKERFINKDCIVDTASLTGNKRFCTTDPLENPLTQIDLNLNPSLGTTVLSILSFVPINNISAWGIFSLILSATATAGNRCPPVPPPANRNLYLFILSCFCCS